MKQELTKCQFHDAFRDMDRKENFSYEGLNALYDYLEELYESIGEEEYTLDVIALCCEFTEYEDFAELRDNYTDIESMDDLRDNTTVIEIDGTDRFIIQNY